MPKQILSNLLLSLASGVVPRTGAPYIAIGRRDEIDSLLGNLSHVAEGGAFARFLIGRYGSGKSFLMQLIRGYALERGFLCADADLSPERRLSGGKGAGLATYRELIRNLASKSSPDGGALPIVLSRHFVRLRAALAEENILPDSPAFADEIRKRVYKDLADIEDGVGGFDFSRVFAEYYSALVEGDDDRKSACLKWLRGEFSGKTEAKNALGFQVSTVITDENWYDFIKLFADLSVKLGYSGLIVYIDECIDLYKITNRISREANYEKILSIFNDTLQGKAEHIGFIFGGTPQFLEDSKRGLYSYDALKSRLEDSKYYSAGYRNLSSPVIRLRRLSDNELFALIKRLTKLYAQSEGREERLTEEQQLKFLNEELSRAGADELVTPREIIRDYLSLLNLLRDNPDATFESLTEARRGRQADEIGEGPVNRGDMRDAHVSHFTLSDIDI